MKTIYTTLPIYDKVEKQWFERGKKGGVDKPVPIICPDYRLPSFQWIDDGDGCASVTTIELLERDGTSIDITAYFDTLPAISVLTSYTYFVYNGDNLLSLLPQGVYYLKITMDNDFVYYSDYFEVKCLYDNLILSFTNYDYAPFESTGTEITEAVSLLPPPSEMVGVLSDTFSVREGETIRVIFDITLNSGELPYFALKTTLATVLISNIEQCTEGANVIELTATTSSDIAQLNIRNEGETDFLTSEIRVVRSYSDEYLTLNFSNGCDIGDILYSEGFTQTLWFESEPMEMSFPLDEKGIENGDARFIRTFGRQVKKYLVRTKEMPGYMVEVFNRMRLHDTIELTDLVGDTNDLYNLEVEHEWLWDDRYYARLDLTFDYNEAFVIGGCCNNLT